MAQAGYFTKMKDDEGRLTEQEMVRREDIARMGGQCAARECKYKRECYKRMDRNRPCKFIHFDG